MSTPTNTPPGWYSGGIPGEERWWDGVAWTAYARPTALPSQPGPPKPSTFWSGSKDGSLIGAIVCAVLAVLFFFGTIITFFIGGFAAVAPALGLVGCSAYAVVLFLNWNGLKKNERIRAQQHDGQPQVIARPPEF